MFDLPKQLPASIPAVAVGRVKVYINDTGDLVLKDGDTLQETRIEANAVSIITVANDAARLAIASPLLDVIYYQVDNRKFYVYVGGQWKLAGGDIQVYNEANLTALNALPADDKKTNAVYIAQDTNFVYRWNGSTFVLIGGEVQVYQATNLAALNALPAADKKLRALYAAQDTNYLYRWNGTAFVQVGGDVQVYQAANLTALNALAATEKKLAAVYITQDENQVYRWNGTIFVRLTNRHGAGATFPLDPILGDTFFDTATDTLFMRVNDGANPVWLDVSSTGGAPTATPRITRFTTSGTFTPSAGVRYFEVEVQAAGGGGGGSGSPGTNQVGIAQGGTGGGYAKAIVTNVTGTYSVTVGAAGAAGTAGGGSGGTAGTSSLTGSNVTVSCAGGTGGNGGASVSSPASATSSQVGGGATVTGTSAILVEVAQGGENSFSSGYSISANGQHWIAGGAGGHSRLGHGGQTLFFMNNQSHAGRVAVGFGSGGGGAASTSGTAAQAGAQGAPAIVIIKEFF